MRQTRCRRVFQRALSSHRLGGGLVNLFGGAQRDAILRTLGTGERRLNRAEIEFAKQALLEMTPASYIGKATDLVKRIN